MSVVRTGYRQVLKHLSALTHTYRDVNDCCFAVFGVLVTHSDFTAGGYGNELHKIARSCFDRPTHPSHETNMTRMRACFAMIRRLHRIQTAQLPSRPEMHRREVLRLADNGEAVSSLAHLHTPNPLPASEGLPAAPDEDCLVYPGTFLIQHWQQKRSRKFYRPTVVTKNTESFPPYTSLLPPEPVYPANIRSSFEFPLLYDAVLGMAALSYSVTEAFVRGDRKAAKALEPFPSRQSLFSATAQLPSLDALLCHIPTSTLTITDFIEVETVTRFVCSNSLPSSSASLGDGASAGSSPLSNVFAYYLLIRNVGGALNRKGWHVQVLSHHLVVLDLSDSRVLEMGRPGVGGNFPTLSPGECHAYEGGTRIRGTEGILRGTLQVNAFSEDGKMRSFDVQIYPTRLSVTQSAPEVAETHPNSELKL